MGNDAICLEKQGKCGAMADMFPVASVEGGDSLIDGLNDKVDVLESKVELLQGTFDVWQKLVESILGTAQTAMQYDNYVLTVLGIAVAVVFALATIIASAIIATINHIANKKKEEAMEEAIKKMNKRIEETTSPMKAGLHSNDSELDKADKKQLISKKLTKNPDSNDER